MGNSDIRDIAEIEEVDISDVAGKAVAVDASNWLYRYMTTTARYTRTEAYTNSEGAELTNLIGVPRGLRKFFDNNIRPVFVFDGKAHALKSDEISRRKQKRGSARNKATQADNSVERSKYQSRSQELNSDIISTTKKLLDYLDIPYTDAPQAAESQAAYITAQSDDIYATVSDDYDAIVFGSPVTLRNLTTSSNTVERMDLSKTLDSQDITYEQLIMAVLLCGTDYNSGISGIGPATSLKEVRNCTDMTEFLENIDEKPSNAREIFNLYKNPTVSDDWPDPRISNPDIDGVRQYLVEQGIDISEVDRALEDIRESGSQAGLGAF